MRETRVLFKPVFGLTTLGDVRVEDRRGKIVVKTLNKGLALGWAQSAASPRRRTAAQFPALQRNECRRLTDTNRAAKWVLTSSPSHSEKVDDSIVVAHGNRRAVDGERGQVCRGVKAGDQLQRI